MLLTAVAIQTMSLLLFIKVIVRGKYYLKVSSLRYLTYTQAMEKPTTEMSEDMEK